MTRTIITKTKRAENCIWLNWHSTEKSQELGTGVLVYGGLGLRGCRGQRQKWLGWNYRFLVLGQRLGIAGQHLRVVSTFKV
jgi:hypothetical protein